MIQQQYDVTVQEKFLAWVCIRVSCIMSSICWQWHWWMLCHWFHWKPQHAW